MPSYRDTFETTLERILANLDGFDSARKSG